jgi:3-deoxy-manno-octulosonate cytidylyltransferase (CMP-KDO synthetase)
MAFTVVIPARFHSSRLPGKPLLDVAGLSMLQRVYQQACKSDATQVYIATDHMDIVNHANGFCDKVIMTRDDHLTGTDRLQEVVAYLSLPNDHIVVNVQGDEPLIPPHLINQVANNLQKYAHAAIATLAEPIDDVEQVFDANAVKLVRDAHNMAMYFSRAPLPWDRSWNTSGLKVMANKDAYLRHIGLYAYRVGFLHRYVTWPQASYEALESLEQLRALHHGERIHVDLAPGGMPAGIDTPEDLTRMREFLTTQGLEN